MYNMLYGNFTSIAVINATGFEQHDFLLTQQGSPFIEVWWREPILSGDLELSPRPAKSDFSLIERFEKC